MRGLLPIYVLTLLTACGGVEMDRGDLSSMYGPATNYKNPVVQRQRGAGLQGQANVSVSGNAAHWTSADGCTYSRTHGAAGETVWYLVQNPHHVGMPNAHAGCAITVVDG